MTTPASPTARSCPTRKPTPCAAFFVRALDAFTQAGITADAVMTDNHWSYTHSRSLRDLLETHGIRHALIRPHCPWQQGKVEHSTARGDGA